MMMASSKVMRSSSSASANSDLLSPPPPPPPLPPSTASTSSSKSVSTSISMDDLIHNIYDPDNKPVVVDDVWSNISDAKIASDPAAQLSIYKDHHHHHHSHSHLQQQHHQHQQQQGPPPPPSPPPLTYEEMTLEDFLAKAGAVHDDDVRTLTSLEHPLLNSSAAAANTFHNQHHQPPQPPPPPPHQHQHQQQVESLVRGFSINGGGGGVEVGGRGKRRTVQEPVDRVAQQRQKRMIKNRESAARSRERKQAYTSELESLVAQLEEENSRLVGHQIEQTKRRFQQLMENLIPVEEKPRLPRVLRKTRSMSW